MDLAKRRAFTERVVAAGRDAGVDVHPQAMAESTATAAQAAAALGVEVGQIVKSLVFSIEGGAETRGVLCLVSGAEENRFVALRLMRLVRSPASSLAASLRLDTRPHLNTPRRLFSQMPDSHRGVNSGPPAAPTLMSSPSPTKHFFAQLTRVRFL
jgi:hypothetical protein